MCNPCFGSAQHSRAQAIPACCVQIGCTNPRCANAAGLHESELKLKKCSRCGEARYCCK